VTAKLLPPGMMGMIGMAPGGKPRRADETWMGAQVERYPEGGHTVREWAVYISMSRRNSPRVSGRRITLSLAQAEQFLLEQLASVREARKEGEG
jgi:hypothetical protein